MTISQLDANLRWRGAFFGHTAYLLNNLIWRRFEPGGHTAGVRDCRGADAFAFTMEAAHLG